MINLIPQRTWKEKAWKTLNIVVAAATLLNVTAFGAAFVPSPETATVQAVQGVPSEGLTTLVANETATPAPVANPALGQACGLDITLILDRSGSLDSTEMAQVKTAAKALVDGFTGTPTQFSVTSFSTAANRQAASPYAFVPNIGFTSNLTAVKAAIDGLPAVGDGSTNWDDGLASAQAIADPRAGVQNLFVMISDGNANKYGFPPQPSGSSDFDPIGALNAAVTRANAIKGTGARVLAIGVGANATGGNLVMNVDNLKAISGTNLATSAAQVTASTDVITSDYASLTNAFSAIAKAYCGGKIVVQKQLDTNSDSQADVTTSDPQLAGWNFTLTGTASASNGNSQTTANAGTVEFAVPAGTFSIAETLRTNWSMAGATCVKGTQPVGSFDGTNHTVTGLTLADGENITCTVLNSLDMATIVVHKKLLAANGVTVVTTDPHVFYVSMDNGTPKAFAVGTDATFTTTAGQHTFTELPDADYDLAGYIPSQVVNVEKGQTFNLTISNKQRLAHITVTKDVRTWDDKEVADAHQFQVTLGGVTKTFAEGAPAVFTVMPGTYAAVETPDTQYTAGPITPARVTVGSNGQATITITNHQIRPPENGSIAIQARVDYDGSGTYVEGNAFANDLGLRWGLDAEGNARLYGTSATVLAGNHTLHDNYGNGKVEFTGWYETLSGNTCNTPTGTQFPSAQTVIANSTVDLTLCYAAAYGQIRFTKVVDGTDPNAWTFQVDGMLPVLNNQTLRLPVGQYTVTEVGPAGYTNISVSGVCSQLGAMNGTAILTVTKQGGVCTFTNTRDIGTLTVHKQLDPDGRGTFSVSDAGANALGFRWGFGTDTSPVREFGTTVSIGAGTYGGVVEKPMAGYHLVGWYFSPSTVYSCANPQSTELPSGINIGKDQNVSMTICNAKDYVAPGTIVVHKTLKSADGNSIVTNDAHPFTVTLDGTSQKTILPGQDITYSNVSAGAHTLAELPDANYTFVGFSPSASINVPAGQTVHVELTNKQKPVLISVIKDVRSWDNKDVSDGHRFNVTLAGITSSFGENAGVSWEVNPGTYSAVESPDPQYTLGSIVPASVTVGSGQSAIITITNLQVKNIDWSVVKTGPATAKPGDTLTYDITWSVANGGNTQLQNLTISDTLPANTSFVSATNGGTASGNTVNWSIPGTFGPGSTGTVHVTVKVADHLNPTTITNTANVCAVQSGLGTGANTTSDTPVCRSAAASTTITSSYLLTLTKTSILTSVVPGAQYTYSLNWSVTGDSATTSALTLTDTLPANVSFVSASDGGVANGSTITWNLGAKSVPSSGTVALTVKAANPLANGTLLKNTAAVCDASSVCGNATHTMPVASGPILTITKTSDVTGFTNPGKNVTYTVVVGNSASATDTARKVMLTDVLPAGFTFVDGGTGTKVFALGDIAPGKTVSTTYTVTISAMQTAGTYLNTATARADNASQVEAHASVLVKLPEILGVTTIADLTITKTVDVKTTNPGKVITYTLTIANNGDADAVNVVVKDTLPKGFVITDTNETSKTWDIGTLEPNHKRVINYDVTVGSKVKAGIYANKAVLTATDLPTQTAVAKVTVKVPKVLGLATTGPSMRDYGMIAFGVFLIGAGAIWFRRMRDAYDDPAIC